MSRAEILYHPRMRSFRCAAFSLAAALLASCAGVPISRAGSDWLRNFEVGDRALRHGRLPEAEAALTEALARAEASKSDIRLAFALDAMGDLRAAQGSPALAEPLFRRALGLLEKTAGPDAPETAAAVVYLSEACAALGRRSEAEDLLRRAVASAEADPRRYAEAAARLSDLASLERAMGRDDQAEAAYRRAVAVTETALGPERRQVSDRLSDLALFEHDRGRFDEAEPLYRRALAIKEKRLGPGDPEVLASLNDLALFEEARGKDSEAETLYLKALADGERAHGRDSPLLASALNNYAHLLRRTGRAAQAAEFEERARALPKRKAERASP